MNTCGLRTLSQWVSRACFSDSWSAARVVSLKQSPLRRPSGRKMSLDVSSGVDMRNSSANCVRYVDYVGAQTISQEAVEVTIGGPRASSRHAINHGAKSSKAALTRLQRFGQTRR